MKASAVLVVSRGYSVTDHFERAFATIVGMGQRVAYASGLVEFVALLSAMESRQSGILTLPILNDLKQIERLSELLSKTL